MRNYFKDPTVICLSFPHLVLILFLFILPSCGQHENLNKQMAFPLVEQGLKSLLKGNEIKEGIQFEKKMCVRKKDDNIQRLVCVSRNHDKIEILFNVAFFQEQGYENATDLVINSKWEQVMSVPLIDLISRNSLALIEESAKQDKISIQKTTAIRKFTGGKMAAVLKSGMITLENKDSSTSTIIKIIAAYYGDISNESALIITSE